MFLHWVRDWDQPDICGTYALVRLRMSMRHAIAAMTFKRDEAV